MKEDLVNLLRLKGIHDEAVLAAIGKIPREEFVPSELKTQAYVDTALPIGNRQTISQPFIVALMTELLLDGKQLNKVLEIGTGSGYQAAVLSQLVAEVYSIERIENLFLRAKSRFEKLKIKNVFLQYGDGNLGWNEFAPYDGIIVTAAAEQPPKALLEQLVDGGRLVIPVANNFAQLLQVISRKGDHYSIENVEHVIFVPLLPGLE